MSPDPLATALAWTDAGRRVALATVIATWRSAPRPVGARMVVAEDGAFEGSVSGGCVEGAVIHLARQVIAEGRPRRLDVGVADDDALGVGLACGGEISVWIEPVVG